MKTITLLALSMLVLVGISAAPKSDDKAGQVKINGTVTHYHAICGATFRLPAGFSRPLEFLHSLSESHLVGRTSGPQPTSGRLMNFPHLWSNLQVS